MRALILFAEKEASDVLSFLLESRFELETLVVTSEEEAAKYLILDPKENILAIIDGEKFSASLVDDKVKRKFSQPLIVALKATKLSKITEKQPGIKYVDRAHLTEIAYIAFDELIQEGAMEGLQAEREFCRIKTNVLLLTSPLRADVYIRLSPIKFLKVMREGDSFDRDDLQKYTEQKKIEYLFLKVKDTEEFISKLKNQLAALLSGAEDSTEVDSVNKMTLQEVLEKEPDAVHHVIYEMSNRLGFTKEVQEIAKMSVQQAVKTMQRNPNLSKLLARLHIDKEKYISSHSMMTGHIACALAKQMEWKSESTYEKLTLAAMLHDITIPTQAMAMLEELSEIEARNKIYSAVDVDTFRKHPVLGGEIAKRFSEIPPDVDTIIVQHHERPDGSGFPRGLTHSRIGPLSAVFIVAHDLVQFLFKADVSKDFQKEQLLAFFEQFKETYTYGNFKKLLNAVPKIGD